MNQQQRARQRLFARRTVLLAAGKLALLSVLGGRLYYLQVVQGHQYRLLAEDNRINIKLLSPPRGRIFDRFGAELAVNRQNYRLVLVPEQAGDTDATLAAVGGYVPLGEDELERVRAEIARKRAFVPVVLREHLSWRQVAAIEINAPYLPGISIEVGQLRQYPHAAALAHVLGYVAAVSESELTGDPLLELPDFRIGKNGVEKIHDLSLRGRAGTQQVEVNAHGRVIRELSRQEGRPGDDVKLTLDLGLQEFAAARLGAESAAAAVLDIATGEVLALTSTPGFDPNLFNQGLTRKQWNELVENPRAPLINKAIAGQYPPGSTFKVVAALTALDSGLLGPGHSVYCPGHLQLGNRRFHCWKKGGHGRLAMVEAISRSCDVYFYDVALKVGVDRLAEMAHRLGLGARLGLDLPGEAAGLMPTQAWKRATYGEPWHKGETLNTGIGQGYVLTTPLQLAVACARIAGGRAVVPRLALDVRHDGAEAPAAAPAAALLGIDPAALEIVRAGMNKVVNDRTGTAWRARIEDEALAMAGKTGTSQVRRISKREHETGVVKNEDKPWAERDHALFIAFAPVAAPRYACAVVVEHGGGGSAVAAPMVRDILIEAQGRDSARTAPPVATRPPADPGRA
ncbi:MAG TPA: penicillin-binding protein 2 [Alphaproteobacteria bacterium]